MADRRGPPKRSGNNEAQASKAPARKSTFFINGAGIDREVITTDICRYLGNDALVRPGTHKDTKGNTQDGYYITAYRAPTSEQLSDLRADSDKWQREREREKNSAGARGEYSNSTLREGIWGSNPDQSQPPEGSFQMPQQGYGGMPQQQAPQDPQRGAAAYPGRGGPSYSTGMPTMPPPQPPGSFRPDGYPPQGPNYTTYPPQPVVGYPVDNNRDRMNTAPRGMPQNTAYPPSTGMPPVQPGYGQGHTAGSYYPAASGPGLQTGYRPAPQPNYPDPYGRADSGTPQEDPAQDFYNDDDMDYEETPAPNPPQNQPPRRGGRDNERERDRDRDHEAPRKHRHR